MTDFRCSNCNRLLAKVESGMVQIKCPHCRTMNEWLYDNHDLHIEVFRQNIKAEIERAEEDVRKAKLALGSLSTQFHYLKQQIYHM